MNSVLNGVLLLAFKLKRFLRKSLVRVRGIAKAFEKPSESEVEKLRKRTWASVLRETDPMFGAAIVSSSAPASVEEFLSRSSASFERVGAFQRQAFSRKAVRKLSRFAAKHAFRVVGIRDAAAKKSIQESLDALHHRIFERISRGTQATEDAHTLSLFNQVSSQVGGMFKANIFWRVYSRKFSSMKNALEKIERQDGSK